MKRILLIGLLLCSSISIVTAQCNEYYQFQADSEWEMENYNAKEKLQSKVNQKVKAYSSTAHGFEATILSKTYNEKGKEQASMDLNFTCENGTIYVDMRNFVSEEQLKVFESYEMKIEGENLEYPNSISAGQNLKDASITISSSNGMPLKMTVDISDRRVIGKESVTTPAGTFECFVITTKMRIKTMIGMEFATKEWLAPKVGVVRSETYNKSNKLMGYSILTKRN